MRAICGYDAGGTIYWLRSGSMGPENEALFEKLISSRIGQK